MSSRRGRYLAAFGRAVRARSHLQHLADGLDPELVTMLINETDHLSYGRSSSNEPRAVQARLVAEHRAGAGVKELAKRFGIHRGTVSNILRREGALRVSGVQPDDMPEVVRLYEEGWSLARLAEKFGVSPGAVNRALRGEGVRIRRAGRPSRS